MKQKYYILAFAALALIGLFYWTGVRKQAPRFDWEEAGWKKNVYSKNSDQPYGTQIFHRLLKASFPGESLTDINKSLAAELPLHAGPTPGTYLFIGSGMFLDSADTQQLLHFVEQGNTALIISKSIPFDLMNLIYYEECSDEAYWSDYGQQSDSSVSLSLIAPQGLPAPQVFMARQNIHQAYSWSYLPDEVFCPHLKQYPLGYHQADSLINFAAFPHGKGRFLLHTTPLAFSNYHLVRPEVQQYAAGILSFLPQGPIWWDAFSGIPEIVSRHRNSSRSSGDNDLPEEHALSYMLRYESLAWAWYILLALGLLYMVFRALRKQRPVPVLPVNENSSFEFINTIANLHFKAGNFKGISIQAMKLFLARIREKYGISAYVDTDTNLVVRMDDNYIHKLATRSGIAEAQIRDMFGQYETIARFEPTEQHAVDFYLTMENFWKKAE